MILFIQAILIAVLMLILVALYIDEKQKNKLRIPIGRMIQFWDSGIERRRFLRVESNVPVKYSTPKKNNHKSPVKTKNISIGGICLTLTEKIPLKNRLRLEINLPDSLKQPIFAQGDVAWVNEVGNPQDNQGIRHFDVGIEFKDISSKDLVRISNFVKDVEKN